MDDASFAALTEPYRPELLAHCYRMLGSLHDAEDLVQETYVRAWRAFDRFEGRSSVRRWLYKIATMACLTALETRGRRPLPSGLGGPASDYRIAHLEREQDVPWLEPLPDVLLESTSADPAAISAARAGVRLAFIAALQLLSARQRAVLTLRDVLAFRTAEVAEMLDVSAAAVDSTLRRARARLAEAGPVQDEISEPDDESVRRLLDSYVDAFTRADARALVSLLRADVAMEMPPIPTWFAGRESVVEFLAARVLGAGDWRFAATRANTQPAFAVYRRVEEGSTEYAPYGVQVLTVADGLITRISSFNQPRLVSDLGRPGPLC
jgi:RNA polymerase sigma-70 factor (ECF subfamily)